VAQFTSKLTVAEREEIITLAAFGHMPASIHAAIGGKVSLRTVQRIVKAEAQDITYRRREFEHQREQRELEEQHSRSLGEAPMQYEPHALPQGLEPEPRYASELGPNARERVGLPAMPPEETTEQFLAREYPGRRFYARGAVTLGEDEPLLYGPPAPRPPYSNEQLLAGVASRRRV